jgi:hypothetical protein
MRSNLARLEGLLTWIVVVTVINRVHIGIWSKFPVWYHLTFLFTMIQAVLMGALLPSRRRKRPQQGFTSPAR